MVFFIIYILVFLQFSLNKQLLSTIAANCERFIGTQGGGMDQAIAFLAEKGISLEEEKNYFICCIF